MGLDNFALEHHDKCISIERASDLEAIDFRMSRVIDSCMFGMAFEVMGLFCIAQRV